jgi:hypothetical protein
MAFKIVANEDVSMFLRPNDITTKSFIAGRDPEPLFAAPLPPGQGIRRNLHSDFFRCENDEAEEESVSLPPPSSKDMVRVFLRINRGPKRKAITIALPVVTKMTVIQV